jgi:uncharacterized ferritin-like protein (DUF455 family)
VKDTGKFLAELDAQNGRALAALGTKAKGDGAGGPNLSVPRLLKLALKNELEAAEIAAIWSIDAPELDFKMSLMRQCGDEARHFRLITERLAALAIDTTALDPRSGGPTELHTWLKTLTTTVERVAAGQFTREAIALVRNQVFIDFCEASGDDTTAALYRDIIQPDEKHHHEMGRKLLQKYAVEPALQEKAAAAAKRTLEIAEELQEIAALKGVICAPGC